MAFIVIRHYQFQLINNCKTTVTLPRRLRVRVLAYRGNVPVNSVEQIEETSGVVAKVKELQQKLKLIGINCDESCIPGRYSRLFCPECKGGQSVERSLSLHIIRDGKFAMWRCFRADCGWAGQTFAGSSHTRKAFSPGQVTEKSLGLGLQPVSEKLIAYFGERMISKETLRRNSVMQMSGDQVVIAFPYVHKGEIVGCKYRTIEKRFWQEKGTEKWLYGLDDIYEAAAVIIVEGEIDKLAVEEAGFRNCVSVPSGAPSKISAGELPPWEKDYGYQYLWNCKEYLEKVSRVVLATDGDKAGQALAEGLARRLGKERCWLVRWPKKDQSGCYKDANEVLKFLGPDALKEAIENAELY